MESDLTGLMFPPTSSRFLSTLSAWRATIIILSLVRFVKLISIHALRMESDMKKGGGGDDLDISIHALRMESDYFSSHVFFSLLLFLSTLSAWRATFYHSYCLPLTTKFLSTLSAWRATWVSSSFSDISPLFLSTLSAWRATKLSGGRRTGRGISIHALRMESDGVDPETLPDGATFLSTLSAWRATPQCRRPLTRPMIFLSTLSAWRATPTYLR